MTNKITFQCQRNDETWPHFAWLVEINGINFEYRTGLGHATPKRKGKYQYEGFNKKPEKPCVNADTHWIHIPAIDSILHCLFSDADAGNYSFDDFCGNLGYDNDSLKALDFYRACMESSKKLRKALGAEYSTEKQRIDALEL